eukprot:3896229-Pyramimonas_sp.AAC.1
MGIARIGRSGEACSTARVTSCAKVNTHPPSTSPSQARSRLSNLNQHRRISPEGIVTVGFHQKELLPSDSTRRNRYPRIPPEGI